MADAKEGLSGLARAVRESRSAPIVPEEQVGKRSDPTYVQVSILVKDTTRARVKQWLKANRYEQAQFFEELALAFLDGREPRF